jgi:hypothetical protein
MTTTRMLGAPTLGLLLGCGGGSGNGGSLAPAKLVTWTG